MYCGILECCRQIFKVQGLESYDILSSVAVLHSLKSEMAPGINSLFVSAKLPMHLSQTEASNCSDALSFH